ncbi:hypothetical protein [Arthrobacter sp. Y-9]|uniref:hypothetical protein n=1 Tax=Arthrobacter sp. Y-9 TaxID=3039385 RepID=UPI00241E2DA2|nr:hypothetical protein [Arthrobacter sp. Y-9]WFR84657.1 hypothetical protein P9849_03180 [Arthrobacter sp. Y-9]
MSDTVYFKNPAGGVNSCTREHWNHYLTVLEEGVRYPKHGFTELTEDEAREAHPQLLGAPDLSVVYRPDELTRLIDRERSEQRLLELSEQNMAARRAAN